MSDVRDPATDQALPVVNDRPFIQDLVIADIEERKQHGIRKYGTALQSGNGRDMLLDAYEEALDLAIYLRGLLDMQEREERWWITTSGRVTEHTKVAGPFVTSEDATRSRSRIEERTGNLTFWIRQEGAS